MLVSAIHTHIHTYTHTHIGTPRREASEHAGLGEWPPEAHRLRPLLHSPSLTKLVWYDPIRRALHIHMYIHIHVHIHIHIHRCGTMPYVAPEALLGRTASFAVDMWSYGVVMCVCVYMCICVYMYMSTCGPTASSCAYVCICVYVYMCICRHVVLRRRHVLYTYTYIHTYMHVVLRRRHVLYTYTYIHTYMHTYMWSYGVVMCVCVYACMYVCMYVHVVLRRRHVRE